MKIEINKEVSRALSEGKPVVALESTIISHGMPYPKNKETALEVEEIVRSYNVTPATIAIVKGVVKIGLSLDEIDYLAKKGREVTKTSRRDIAYVVSTGGDGATTVSATMILAHKAGIKVFVTGGIGGVHRGGQDSMDISADLDELSKTPVIVVCSGVKSILDIPRTREYLETKGVAVCGYKSNDFPAFYLSNSGLPADYNVDEDIVSKMYRANSQLGISSGIVVGVGVPEEYQMDEKVINDAINNALSDAKQEEISGKEITPYLLSKIVHLTEGKSLETNIRLICNNACIGSKIALKLSE